MGGGRRAEAGLGAEHDPPGLRRPRHLSPLPGAGAGLLPLRGPEVTRVQARVGRWETPQQRAGTRQDGTRYSGRPSTELSKKAGRESRAAQR